MAVRGALRRRNTFDDCLQHLRYALTCLGTDQQCIRGVEADRAFDHLFSALDVGALQVNFVDDGDDLQPVIDCQIGVGQCLCFYTLGGIHYEQCPFAGCQRSRDFIRKVHVTGRIDQVELINLAIPRLIHHADSMCLDGDAALALEIHGIKDLRLHLPGRNRPGQLQQAVGQRGFAVINVCDDREITDEGAVHAGLVSLDSNRREQQVAGASWQVVACRHSDLQLAAGITATFSSQPSNSRSASSHCRRCRSFRSRISSSSGGKRSNVMLAG